MEENKANTQIQPQQQIQPIQQTISPDYERLHYDKHISFFKWMMSIAGLILTGIVGVILSMTWGNMKEYREESRKDMAEMKNDIKELRNESMNTIKDTKEQLYKQVPAIRDEAQTMALIAVRKSIEQQFETQNIRLLVEQTAEQKLGSQANVMIEKYLKKASKNIDEQTKIVTELIFATDQIRNGFRKGYRILDSLRNFHELELVRNMASDLLKRKETDYEIAQNNINTDKDSVLLIPAYGDSTIRKDPNLIIGRLINTINKDEDLNTVALSVTALRKLTDIKFDLFDFLRINIWYIREFPKQKNEIKKIFSNKIIKVEENYVPTFLAF